MKHLYAILLLITCTSPCFGQSALRSSLAGEAIAEARKEALANQDYNLKLGPANVLFAASAGFTYNDNIRIEAENERDDFIITPGLDIGINWPVTTRNAFNLSTGIGYSKYIDHSEFDRLRITPDSEISFDFYTGDFRINVYNRFSYTLDPIADSSVAGVGEFGGFDNSIGTVVDWDLKDLILSMGYEHYNFISDASESDRLERSEERLFARAMFLGNGIFWGAETGASFIDYDEKLFNDGVSVSVGPFVTVRLSEYTELTTRGGYVYLTFDDGGLLGDTDDVNDFYADIQLSNRLNKYLSHSIGGGRDVDIGTNSQVNERWYVNYSMALTIIQGLGISAGVEFQRGEDDDAGLGETYDRWGPTLGLSYQLMEKLSSSLSYRYFTRESDRSNRDYDVNDITFNFNYRF